MKKLNNKAFAISTLLYGLMLVAFMVVSLLMSIMATNRKNTSTLVQKIEEELNRYSETVTEFSYTGEVQEFIVPYGKAGWYKIELWGAEGGTSSSASAANSGKGAYTSGIVYLEENTYLYFYIGGQGQSNESNYRGSSGGYNGGGNSGYHNSVKSTGGGGATDVRTYGGAWNDSTGLKSRIMVAAGGGGIYNKNGTCSSGSGGNGGGLIGKNGGAAKSCGFTSSLGATQIEGGKTPYYTSGQNDGKFGIGLQNGGCSTNGKFGCGYGGGGGGGYYAGATGYGSGGSGGSSYISGYAGVNSVNTSGNNTNKTLSHTGLSFINGVIIPGVNSGNGKAKIELVSTDKPATKNTQLDNVRYIKDCITTSDKNGGYELWSEFQAIDQTGNNVAKGKKVNFNGTDIAAGNKYTDGDITKISGTTTSGTIGEKCIIVDLGRTYNLEEIAVFHHFNSGNSYNYETISVSPNNVSYTSLKTWNSSNLAVSERSNGVRISSRQVETLLTIPTGNYYLMSASSENRVLNLSGVNVAVDLFTGDKTQKWTIEEIGGGAYKIVENKSQRALQPDDGGLENNENVGAKTTYNSHAWEQWTIVVLNNGYYRFKSKANSSYCLAVDDNNNVIISTCNNTKKQQFKLITADY